VGSTGRKTIDGLGGCCGCLRQIVIPLNYTPSQQVYVMVALLRAVDAVPANQEVLFNRNCLRFALHHPQVVPFQVMVENVVGIERHLIVLVLNQLTDRPIQDRSIGRSHFFAIEL
jgi:hypothetical protein